MKKVLLIGVISLLSFTSCNTYSNLDAIKVLYEPKKTQSLSKEEIDDNGFKIFLDKYDSFSSNLSGLFIKEYNDNTNIAISPLSIFLALTMGVEISSSNTREELLSALDLNYEQVKTYTKNLIDYCSFEDYSSFGNTLKSTLKITNSLWMNNNCSYIENTLSSLADNYYCYSFDADFTNNNEKVNDEIKSFIKKESHDLIDWNYKYNIRTLFTIINVLYLKDIWDYNSSELQVINNKTFLKSDNKEIKKDFLCGNYFNGKKYVGENYTHFFTKTASGFKLKFIVPNIGISVNEVFTKENIKKINSINDYNEYEQETKTRYFTRCIFPGFEASLKQDIIPFLSTNFNINSFFSSNCNLSNLFDANNPYINAFLHQTKLVVDKKGIEGSAVTMMAGNESAGPGEDIMVYEDYVVDRSFGYILTDKNNNVVFTGVINK